MMGVCSGRFLTRLRSSAPEIGGINSIGLGYKLAWFNQVCQSKSTNSVRM